MSGWSRRIRCVGLLALSALVPSAAHSGGYEASQPSPQGTVFVRRPSIVWPIAPYGGLKVTEIALKVDGETVKAVYAEKPGRIQWEPDRPLTQGDHKVACTVVFDRRHRVGKEWSFRIAADAAEFLPPISPLQQKQIDRANAIRRLLGLPDFATNLNLSAAAASHAAFMNRHNSIGHHQPSDLPGFVGRSAMERALAFGYSGAVWEDVGFSSAPDANLVQELFNAPYHRLPFLQPGSVPLGVGAEGRFLALCFGENPEPGVTQSPAPDQIDVPCSWDGIETPSPLAPHGLKGPVGYPVLLAWFVRGNGPSSILSATLHWDGSPVRCAVNTPANDPNLSNAVILIPERPLEPYRTYTVSVSVNLPTGSLERRTWRFTTGAR